MAIAPFRLRPARSLAPSLAFVLVFGPASALLANQEATFRLECPELSIEDVAQAEARVQITRLSERNPPSVHVRCDLVNERIFVGVREQTLVWSLEKGADRLINRLIATIERALTWDAAAREPAPAANTGSGAAAREATPEISPLPEPLERATPPRRVESLRPLSRSARRPPQPHGREPAATGVSAASGSTLDEVLPDKRSWSIEARAIAELQTPALAWGAGAGLRYRIGALWCGLAGAILWAPDPDFDALDSSLGLDASLRKRSLWLRAGLGVSRLTASSRRADLVGVQPGPVTAAYAELRALYAIEVDGFSLAPGVGVRVFTSERDISVDGERRLSLLLAAPSASLALLY